MKRTLTLLLIGVMLTALATAGGRGESESAGGSEKLEVFVSIQPQKQFVEAIGGSRVKVHVMVPPGKSPATYEPTPQQVVKLGEAQAFFRIGVPFEKTFLKTIEANLPRLAVIDTGRGIEKRFLGTDHHEEAHRKLESAHPDPHIWLDPLLVKRQAATIAEELIQLDPDGEEVYQAGLAAYSRELDTLHQELKTALNPVKGEIFFTYHPSFGYLADRYGLRQEAIETGGKEPGAAALEAVIEEAREKGVKVIFAQPEFSVSSAQAIADAIEGVIVPVAPLKEDYLQNMRTIAEEIREGLNR